MATVHASAHRTGHDGRHTDSTNAFTRERTDVATSLSIEQSFGADPATVMAMLRDPEYVRAKAERTGGYDVSVTVTDAPDGGVVITSTRSMPAEVPSYAKSFVGDSLTITEVQTWGPVGADGTASAQVTVDFHAPISYHGTITMSPTSEGTILTNTGEFKASVPFVGGKVERVAAEQTERYLNKETQVGAEWLAR